jgi:hypothetical protein
LLYSPKCSEGFFFELRPSGSTASLNVAPLSDVDFGPLLAAFGTVSSIFVTDLAIEALHISVPALVGKSPMGSTSPLAYESRLGSLRVVSSGAAFPYKD